LLKNIFNYIRHINSFKKKNKITLRLSALAVKNTSQIKDITFKAETLYFLYVFHGFKKKVYHIGHINSFKKKNKMTLRLSAFT
jgi:hypothetical protein